MIRKLEVLANIAVIATSVVLCSVLVKKFFFSPAKQEESVEASPSESTASRASRRPSIKAGTKISLPGIDWSKSTHTILLVLSTTCHFCTESAPFYQKLEQERPNNLRLIAVLPQSVDEGRAYLTRLGLGLHDTVQAPLASVGASATPTLLLIDDEGSVKDSWVGKLSDTEAASVIAQVRNDY